MAQAGRQALRAVWSAVQTATNPEGRGDAGAQRAVEEEARESNARTVRWVAVVAVLANALPMALFRGATDPAGTAWAFWMTRLGAVVAMGWIAAAIVAWQRRPAALWRVLGDLVGVLALMGGAARSANTQRVSPNISLFVIAGLAVAFFVRVRPRVFVPALLAGTALVLGGITRFRDRGPARLADEVLLVGTTAIVLAAFFIARSLLVRAVLARRQVEIVNAELERRVEAQVQMLAERERAEAALLDAKRAADAANRAKSAFLANMSHEIRTPLNAVLGYTQLLQRNPGITGADRDHLDVIQRSGDHLLDLINNVLEMSKIEAGHRKLHQGVVDLRRLLADLERLFRLRTSEKRLSFAIREGPGVPQRLVGDEGRLRQVLVNLVGNAVKFTERGGVVVRVLVQRATADHEGGSAARLVVEVEDTGPGIAQDEVSRLFQPFSQLRVGIHAQGGSGLGLALSRDFAHLMDGDLTVESTPTVGSVFRLEIPFVLADAPLPAGGVSEPSALAAPARRVLGIALGHGRPSVLVVDDDEDNRSWVRQLLSQVGFDVREANNGVSALDRLAEQQPRLVLMDMNMPIMDGYTAIRAIRAIPGGAEIAIFALTASAFDEDREAILATGAECVLRKPFRGEDLLEVIRARLGIAYVHGDALSAARAPAPPIPDVVLRTHAAALPAALVAEISAAVSIADYQSILALLDGFPADQAAAAEALRALLEQYRYEDIAAALEDVPRAG